MKESLEDFIKSVIEGIMQGKIDPRVESYTDYKNRFTVLKPTVKVEVELTSGKVAVFDITDYFERIIH